LHIDAGLDFKQGKPLQDCHPPIFFRFFCFVFFLSGKRKLSKEIAFRNARNFSFASGSLTWDFSVAAIISSPARLMLIQRNLKRTEFPMEIGHIMQDHLPGSKQSKGAFDLFAMELLDPNLTPYFKNSEFRHQTPQWQSMVLCWSLIFCVTDICEFASIERCNDGRCLFCPHVKLPIDIG
jgi:hypothetical protein